MLTVKAGVDPVGADPQNSQGPGETGLGHWRRCFWIETASWGWKQPLGKEDMST